MTPAATAAGATGTTPGTTTSGPAGASPRAETLIGLEYEVAAMVRRIRRLLAERARTVHPDLQPGTYLMLWWIDAHGPMRASTLAEALAIDKGAVSRQLQHLLELDLIRRSPDPDDGRATLLATSEEAHARLAEIGERARQWLDGRLSDLADDELAQFVRLLGRYNAALDA